MWCGVTCELAREINRRHSRHSDQVLACDERLLKVRPLGFRRCSEGSQFRLWHSRAHCIFNVYAPLPYGLLAVVVLRREILLQAWLLWGRR